MDSSNEISTEEAANTLNVSISYFLALLKNGELPYREQDGKCYVIHGDLMKYKSVMAQQSDQAMDELVQIAQEEDMGYENK